MSRIPSFDRSTEECLEKISKERGELLPEDEVFIHVFAPVICSYVYYVLKDAKRRGVKRLVFLARDGFLPYKAALELGPVIAPEIELSIISVSRYALRGAEYALDETDPIETICLGSLEPTFEKMMKRASLSDLEISNLAEKIGMAGRTNSLLTHKEIAEIKERLRTFPEFYEAVKIHSADKLQKVTDYLKQEDITKDSVKDTFIVDSGWIGTIQRSLRVLISGGEDIKLEGYYFGLYSVPKGENRNTYHNFYISPGSGLKNLLRKVNFNICLFESICSSPESMTYGYEYSEGKLIPVTDANGNPNKEFINRAEEHLMIFANVLASRLQDEKPDEDDLRKMCYKLLKRCMSDPTVEESKALGNFFFSDEVVESDSGRLAGLWNQDDLKANGFIRKMLVKAGFIKGKLPVSGWPEGSIAGSSKGIKKRLCLASEKASKTVTEVRKTVIT